MAHWKNCYIYAIRHNKTHKVYIGCSSDSKRIRNHLSQLKNGKHPNKAMQDDCNKYGFKFTVFLLEVVLRRYKNKVEPHEREAYWIHYYGTDDPAKGYNSPAWYTRTDITAFPVINDLDSLQVQLDAEENQ